MIKIENLTFGNNRNRSLYDDHCTHLSSGRRYGIFGMRGFGKTTALFGGAFNNNVIFGIKREIKPAPIRKEILNQKIVSMAS